MALIDEARLVIFGMVVLATGATAVLLVLADPRRSWNRWLAAFLALVAGNYAAQLLGALSRTGALPFAEGPGVATWLERGGFLALALDPAVLVGFASVFPRKRGIATRRLATGALGAAAVLFALLEATTGALSVAGPGGSLVRVAFFAYLAASYVAALVLLLESLATEPSAVMGRQVLAVAAGVAIVVLTRLPLLVDDLRPEIVPLVGEDAWWIASLAARILGPLALAAWAWRRLGRIQDPARRALVERTARVVGLFIAAVAAMWVSSRLIYVGDRLAGLWSSGAGILHVLRETTEAAAYAVRWLGFCAAMFVGIVRYRVLGVDPASLRVAAVSGGALVVFLCVGGVGVLLGPWWGALAGLAAAGALAYARPRPDAAERRGYLRARQLEAYRALVAACLADGRRPDDAEMTRSRRRLDVTSAEHAAIVAIAEAEQSGAREGSLDRFRIVRRLGAGAYARVYLATDSQTGGAVVLKHVFGDAAALEAAVREIEAARRVSHPRIVPVHEIVRLPDGALVVMDLAEGGSLRARFEDQGPLAGRDVAAILDDVLDALEAVHEAGIIHGDVKPENVLLDLEGRALLADFGAARAMPARATIVAGRGAAAGTPLYMAPEVARGAPATARSDLFSVGVVARELLGGRMPEPWAAWSARALAEDPAGRFASASEMRRALPEAGARTGTARLRRPPAG